MEKDSSSGRPRQSGRRCSMGVRGGRRAHPQALGPTGLRRDPRLPHTARPTLPWLGRHWLRGTVWRKGHQSPPCSGSLTQTLPALPPVPPRNFPLRDVMQRLEGQTQEQDRCVYRPPLLLPEVWSRPSYLASLCFSSFICEMGNGVVNELIFSPNVPAYTESLINIRYYF